MRKIKVSYHSSSFILQNFIFAFYCSAYHGHSWAVNEISPYKFNQMKDHVIKDYVHVLPSPDVYRGKYQGDRDDPKMGELYANDAIEIIDKAINRGRKVQNGWEIRTGAVAETLELLPS